jgi:bleomycin hydrolase
MRWLVFLFIAFAGNDLVAQRLSPRSLQLSAPIINCTPVKDQYLSATCWSFSSNSFLETELLRKGKGKLDLSEMYIARFSMKRKIALHVQLKGKNYFTPGGQFHDVIWVIRHYGMVPEEAYPGKPDGQDRHNHAELDTLLTHFVKEQVDAGITGLDAKQNHYVDSLLDHYLGPVPEHFLCAGKNYTPRTLICMQMIMWRSLPTPITRFTNHLCWKTNTTGPAMPI